MNNHEEHPLDPDAESDDHWQQQSLCRGPQRKYFFPPHYTERKDEKRERVQKAQEFCGVCTVQEQCLDFALLNNEPSGVWGGFDFDNSVEVKLLKRRRKVA